MKKTLTSLMYSINTNAKSSILSVFILFLGFAASAQITLFTESIGSVGGTTLIPVHEAANGFDNDGFTMTGTADIRNTLPSSGYAGASGLANVFITNSVGRDFQIAGVNTIGFAPMELSFGIHKSTTASNGSDLIVEVSTDGIVYTALSYPLLPTGTGTAVWHYRTTTSAIPATANLRIRFRQAGSAAQYRIDDIKLVSNGCTNPSITPSGPTTFCAGGSVDLTATSGVSYLWSTGETTQSITVTTSGSYSVTVTAANGCVTTSDPTTVTVNPYPSSGVTASGPTTFCEGGSVSLTADETGASYLWSNGATTRTITVSNSGSFSVSITENGCTSVSGVVTVTENANPTPSITSSGSNIICTGESTTLSTGSYASYLWSNGATTASISVSTSGAYSVTVTDANGCSGTSEEIDIYVRALPIINAGSDVSMCSGSSVELNANGYASDLFISEYVEGSSNNKYIEIYNGTGATVNLGDYRLRNYSNGNSVPNFDNLLSGTLTHGATVVYKNSAAVTYSGAATSQTSVVFNGNDAVVLYKISANQNVDIIGVIGDDPGAEWVSGANSTQNITLRRKSGITGGVTVNPSGTGAGAFITLGSDWDAFAIDDVSGLGAHAISGSFTWSPAAGLSSTSGATVTASPSSTTTYTVSGAFVCSASDAVTVTVNSNPVVTATADPILCNGGTTIVSVSATDGSAPYTGTGTFTVTAGTYSYTVTDANGCSGSASITISEPSALSVSIDPIATSSLNTCAFGNGAHVVIGYGSNTSANLSGSANGGTGPYTYSWTPSAGLSDPNSASTSFTPALNSGCQIYNLSLTAMDANGCVAAASTSVNVVNVLAPAVGNGPRKVSICHRTNGTNATVVIEVSANAVAAHLAHGDCLGSCESSCSGSNKSFTNKGTVAMHDEEEGTHGFKVYPNPNNGEFTLELDHIDATHAVELSVYDLTGKLIFAQSMNAGEEFIKTNISLDEKTAAFQNGLYMVQVINGDHQHYQKIQVVK